MQIHARYILTQWIMTREDFFKKMYLALYCKVCVWEGVGHWTKTAIYWPPLLWPSALCLSRSPDAQPEARGLSFLLSAGFFYHILSPTGLQNYWGPEGPFCWVVSFLTTSCPRLLWSLTHWSPTPSGVPRALSAGCGFPYHISSLTRLISDSIGVPRAPSAGCVFPYHISSLTRLISNSLTSCHHRVI